MHLLDSKMDRLSGKSIGLLESVLALNIFFPSLNSLEFLPNASLVTMPWPIVSHSKVALSSKASNHDP